ncbi:MAG: thiamine-phosphate pyrophosphorylase [Candidatus Omnitrophica bacterium]|nr:thiamine-phosphate pyrophosphorylase [Candidatus Omnitrophota bacterium]
MNMKIKDFSSKQKELCLRIIDANLNRVTEGLRVCEDVTRFVLNNNSMQKKLKTLRHCANDLRKEKTTYFDSISSRNTHKDVGVKTLKADTVRKDFYDLFVANSQRVKESLRVLEEVLKIFDVYHSEKFKKLRFEFYSVEKKGAEELEVLFKKRKV